MEITFDKVSSIVALILLIIVSAMVGGQYIENRNKQSRGLKNNMKYTCGIEGDCETSMNGTYDSREQCESECQRAK